MRRAVRIANRVLLLFYRASYLVLEYSTNTGSSYWRRRWWWWWWCAM